jgi:uncharacterized protein YcnI
MGPLAIAAIIVAIIIVAIIAIAVISALTKKSDDDPLANQPGHDHSHGGAAGCPACQAAANPVKVKVPEKCIVKFRPKAGWTGEFGFDWIRDGQTSLSGDTDYATVVADNKFTTLRDGYYDTFKSSWKKDKDGNDYVYVTPWLSLFPPEQCSGNDKKCEATLTLYIEVVGKQPEVLRMDYDKNLFELTPAEIPADKYSIGEHQMDLTIKYKSKTEVDKEQEIKIFPYKEGEDSLAGKLKIVKNDKPNRYQAKVVFVNVSTNLNGPKVGNIPANEKKIFKQQFYQALITIDTDSASSSASLNLNGDDKDADTSTFKNDYTIPQGVNRVIVSNPAGKIKLHDFLINKFNNDPDIKKTGIDYSGHLKIFCFNERGGMNNGGTFQLAGGETSDIPSPIKAVTVYDLHKTTAPVHESLHAMGLCHSFETAVHINNKFKYLPQKITDNIMDYSDVRQSTWKWQWEILQSSTIVSKES